MEAWILLLVCFQAWESGSRLGISAFWTSFWPRKASFGLILAQKGPKGAIIGLSGPILENPSLHIEIPGLGISSGPAFWCVSRPGLAQKGLFWALLGQERPIMAHLGQNKPKRGLSGQNIRLIHLFQQYLLPPCH